MLALMGGILLSVPTWAQRWARPRRPVYVVPPPVYVTPPPPIVYYAPVRPIYVPPPMYRPYPPPVVVVPARPIYRNQVWAYGHRNYRRNYRSW
jgi:hypothetical protein